MADEFKNATQRPWRAEVNSAKTLAQIFGNRGFGDWILNMEVEGQDGLAALGDGELANLALIVRAVNAFEPMREALTKLRPFVEEDFPPDAPDAFATPACADAYQAMVRAIRAANGES